MLQPTGGYTIGDSTWSVAFLVGMRYWNLSPSLDVQFPRLSNERSATGQWVDATGGARVDYVWSGRLHLIAAADGGGGGSKDTWQVLGSAAYDAWSNWNIGVAYRTLAVNRDHNNILFDTRFNNGSVFATTGSPYYSRFPDADRAQLNDPTRYYAPRRIEVGLNFASKGETK